MHPVVRLAQSRKGTFPVLALHLLLLCLLACGEATPPATPVVTTTDDRLPMGILYDGTQNPEQLRQDLRRLIRAGGNYFGLHVRPDNVAEVPEFARLAAELGLQFDIYDPKRLVERPAELPALLAREDRNTVLHFPHEDYELLNHQLLSEDPHLVGLAVTESLLNTIRGGRVIERRIDLTSVRRAPGVGGTAIGGDVHAVVDRHGNYAVYLPGPGLLDITLPDTRTPRRVTVIGYLGTQRSELLTPPYEATVRLTSEEERGGWMLLTREEEG